MKVTLESTERIVELIMPDGSKVLARLWQGHTANGVECHAYITRIAVARHLDASEFDRDLQEHAPARADVAAIPTRLVL